MPDVLNVGVIGCGAIGTRRHLPEYAANPRSRIVAVADVVEERARAAAEQYGAVPYTDWQELLGRSDVDAVSVCLPNALHAPVTIAALRSGKHVLCEKPMATTLEECEAMVAAARESGRRLMIGHNQRFSRAHTVGRDILRSGELGRVLLFRTAFAHPGPEGWAVDGANSWFFRRKEAFVGALGDLGVHKVDLVRFLLGEEPVLVGALWSTLEKPADVDDNALILLRMQSGALGTVTASWTHRPGEDNSTVIHGEKGTLRLLADPAHQVILQRASGEVVRYQVGGIQTNAPGGQFSSGVIDAFVDAVLSGQPVPVPGEEGLKSMKVIFAALRSQEEGRFVPLAPGD